MLEHALAVFHVLARSDCPAEIEERDDRCQERDTNGGERHQPNGLFAEALAPDAVHDGTEQRHAEDDCDQREVILGKERAY